MMPSSGGCTATRWLTKNKIERVDLNPSRLVLREQLGRRAPAGLTFDGRCGRAGVLLLD
jgi:hypothetical protein